MDNILGETYNVLNFGRSATTMTRNGDFPYWIAKEFFNVFESKPDIIIIKLGTNDTKSHNWDTKAFIDSYQAMIDTFKTIESRPKIYLCKPVPVFVTKWGINDSTVIAGIIPAIEKFAKTNNLDLIDLYKPMIHDSILFPDGIHPNEEAMVKMAEIIAKILQSNI